jgi:enamine deaminase RidA (YjgF/YER057c/UK114 family)
MKKERIYSPEVPEPPPGQWSNCVRVGDIVYVSGMTAREKDGQTVTAVGEYEQTKKIFTKISHMIAAAGGVMNDITSMQIFVTRIEHNTEVWRARKEFFSGDFPASTLVEVSRLAKPEIVIEINVVAHIGCSGEKI